jgi:hypothetical protein
VISILEGGYSLSTPVTVPSIAKSHKPLGTRAKRATSNDTDDDDSVKNIEKFAQLPGDGGLVKGVLAHVAALAQVDNWMGSLL